MADDANVIEYILPASLNNRSVWAFSFHVLLLKQLLVSSAAVEIKNSLHFQLLAPLRSLPLPLGSFTATLSNSSIIIIISPTSQPEVAQMSQQHTHASGDASELHNRSTQGLIVLWGVFGVINRFQQAETIPLFIRLYLLTELSWMTKAHAWSWLLCGEHLLTFPCGLAISVGSGWNSSTLPMTTPTSVNCNQNPHVTLWLLTYAIFMCCFTSQKICVALHGDTIKTINTLLCFSYYSIGLCLIPHVHLVLILCPKYVCGESAQGLVWLKHGLD